MEKWASTESCHSHAYCTVCLNVDGGGTHWRRVTALSFDLPAEGTCPFGRTWDDAVADRARIRAEARARMGEHLDVAWDPALSPLRDRLTDAEFVGVLTGLITSGAFGPDEERATEVAETIAERRGVDLDAGGP